MHTILLNLRYAGVVALGVSHIAVVEDVAVKTFPALGAVAVETKARPGNLECHSGTNALLPGKSAAV